MVAVKAGTAPKPLPAPGSSAPAGGAPAPEPAAPAATDRAPSRPAKSSSSARSTGSGRSARQVFTGGGTVDNGAGVILAALVLVWVVIPFAKGGVDEIRAVWRAKWLNKDVKGRWL